MIDRARKAAARDALGLASSIDWIVADLMTWTPPRQYDVAISQYVHPAAPFDEFVVRLGNAVARSRGRNGPTGVGVPNGASVCKPMG